jgi:hypothetical protein
VHIGAGKPLWPHHSQPSNGCAFDLIPRAISPRPIQRCSTLPIIAENVLCSERFPLRCEMPL